MMKDTLSPELTTEQVKNVPNVTGVGGFSDHPEHRNNGGRYSSKESFSYWFNYFKDLTVEEFDKWDSNNPKCKRTVASNLVYLRMVDAKSDFKVFQDVANRSEGSPAQTKILDINSSREQKVLVLPSELIKKYGMEADESF